MNFIKWQGIKKHTFDCQDKEFAGWKQAEVELCHHFYKPLPILEKGDKIETQIENAKNYLTKVEHDPLREGKVKGKSKTLFYILMAGEAFVFGYLLFQVGISSEVIGLVILIAAMVIGLMAVFALYGLTLASGKELYIQSRTKAARDKWNEAKKKNPNIGFEPDNNNINLTDTKKDDESPPHVQMLNRFTHHASFTFPKWTVSLAALVLLMGVSSYHIRSIINDLEVVRSQQEITQSTNEQNQESTNTLSPDEERKKRAEQLFQLGIADAVRDASDISYFTMAAIFVLLQIASVYISMNSNFVGKESEDAYTMIQKYNEHKEALRKAEKKRKEISKKADAYLLKLKSHLQNSIKEQRENINFMQYTKIKEAHNE